MIQSFGNTDTEELFREEKSRRFSAIARVALRKLIQMNRAIALSGNEIVLGKRAVTPAMSVRFGALFGQSEGFWHGLQVECEFRALARQRRKLTAHITPAKKLIAA
jgi:plasmid maintenance system antidote protein VapI